MRNYLVEDLAQIQRYFPSAEPIAIQTPFDLTERSLMMTPAHEEAEPYNLPDWSAQWTM